MPEKLLQFFSIEVQQKLYEKETSKGNVAVYQTLPFGTIVTQNNQIVISESDSFFYHEMITHPALFTHSQPRKVAIIGNSFGVLPEILKHPQINQIHCVDNNLPLQEIINQYFPEHNAYYNNPRITQFALEANDWLAQCEANTYDVIIQTEPSENFLEEHFQHYYRVLTPDGIFVQPCLTSLLHVKTLKPIYQHIELAGFNDSQLLNFPQPSYPSGWRTILMATKRSVFRRVREKDVFNRPFKTQYYNFDIHQAALVMPEFMREALGVMEEKVG